MKMISFKVNIFFITLMQFKKNNAIQYSKAQQPNWQRLIA
jgi:hypothetical protein